MTSGTDKFGEMASVALLGAGRASGALDLPGQFGGLLSESAVEDRFLRVAGVLDLTRRAGMKPRRVEETPPSEAPPEPLTPVLEPQLADLLSRIFKEGPGALIREACELLALCSRVLPPRVLPHALERAREEKELREAILRVAGQRGAWLAAQNPDWNFAQIAAASPADPRIWNEGDAPQRAAFLRELRGSEPARALEQLRASFESETARDRATLIAALGTGLTAADEPFLAQTLAVDRAKEVRLVAAGLLSRLPESALALRMMQRLETCLRQEKKLLRAVTIIEPPAAFNPEWKGDGLEEKPPAAAKLGERAWWLQQLVRFTPLSFWASRFTPKEAIEFAGKSDWKEVLLAGWRGAAANQPGHGAWVLALMEQGGMPEDEAMERAGELPAKDRQEIVETLLRRADSASVAGSLIQAADFPWSPDLWHVVKQPLLYWLKQEDWRFRSALPVLACRMPAAFLATEFAWPDIPMFSEAVAEFTRVQERRRMLHRFLAP